MIIVPIIAAAGYTIPKTSSRAITSPSGTADTMEALCNVTFSIKEIEGIVKKINSCITWAGYVDLASADDKLIKLRNPLSIDPEGLLLSSVLAKKAAVGATHTLIDIPIGKKTKIKSMAEGRRLARKFQSIGRELGIKVRVILTDGSQPIGNGIGANLEARDILYILKRDEKAPKDLEEKALYMAALSLEMVGVKNSINKAKDILYSKKAYEMMKKIIKTQGGNPNIKPSDLKVGKYSHNFKANKSGIIKEIDNAYIAKIARIAGSPIDKEAGIYLYYHINDKVKKNDILFTIYAKNKSKLDYSSSLMPKNIIKIV